jgi:hypothetical protein
VVVSPTLWPHVVQKRRVDERMRDNARRTMLAPFSNLNSAATRTERRLLLAASVICRARGPGLVRLPSRGMGGRRVSLWVCLTLVRDAPPVVAEEPWDA